MTLKGEIADFPLPARVSRIRRTLELERAMREHVFRGKPERANKVREIDDALFDLSTIETFIRSKL